MYKILHVINSLELAGAEKFLVELVTQLSSSKQVKIDVYVFNGDLTPLMRQLCELRHVKVYTADATSTYSLKSLIKLYGHLKKNTYDVVHAHLTAAQLFCAILSYLLPKKLIFITTEHSTNNRRRNIFFKWLDIWMYKVFASIVCISDAVEKSLNNWLPLTAKKTCVILNGIELAALTKIERVYDETSQAKSVFNLLCIGRLVPEKNQSILIEAIQSISNVNLYLAGDGICRPQLQKQVKQCNLENRVFFLGKCHDIPAILSKADAYVQPSIWEGFGLAAVEAMASGLPIIANNVPGLRDIIGEAGISFDNNTAQLTQIINTLKDDVNLRRKLSIQARERAKLYDIKIAADNYAELYKRYCSR